MKTKLLTLLASSLLTGFSLPAANIAWVSYHPADNTPDAAAVAASFTNAPDAGYTMLLAANGHTVTRFLTVDSIDTFPDTIAAFNTNDLVIISRSVPSGHYQQANETAAYNGIVKPVMLLGGYITRGGTGGGSRLGLTAGETMVDANSTLVRLKVNAPSHPIFTGVTLDTTNLMVNPYAQRMTFTNTTSGVTTLQVGISVNNNNPIAGGTILAVVGGSTDAARNGMVIGEILAGATASHFNEILAAKRLIFLSGSREAAPVPGNGSGIYDLQPDGAQLFLNAVTYLTTSQAPKCTVPLDSANNLVPGDAWTFAAGPIGDAPLTYQWYKDSAPIAGATNAGLAFTNLTSADAGAYFLVVSNPIATATSTVGRLDFHIFPPTSITNSLISYWPLDTVLGTKTPDLVSGHDMTLVKMGATNLTTGKFGSAFNFDNATQSILERVHAAGEALPIYQHPDFTVSLWVNGPWQSDHRVFAEGNTTNATPMFSLGTHNSATLVDGTVDIYIRNNAGTVVGDHRHSIATAFDYANWHHIAYVQRDVGNGAMKAQLWVDGVLDPVVITPVRPMWVETTAIGGLRRAGASAWFTGQIDEVAVWNRALSAAEIGILQVPAITNPPSRLQPLGIKSFKADLPILAAGGSTKLRWDVSKDLTQATITPLGDVTGDTVVGVGSRAISPTAATTYVLTVKRGSDTLSATTSVAVIQGVTTGWTLLDNFDYYPPGNLSANGYWSDVTSGSGQVLSVNANRAVRTATGNSMNYLNLRDLTINENQARTLFFRVIPGAGNGINATNIVGLTDKSMRSYGDSFFNIGPVLYVAAFTNDLTAATTNAWYLGARNGYAGNNVSNPIDYPGAALEAGTVYNVWLDVTNVALPNYPGDTFTVYIQKEGDAARTVLFQDYNSDRDPYYAEPVLGGMLPTLDKLIVLGNNATYSAVFDDFYLSTGGYNPTVPRPYGYTGELPGPVSIRSTGSQLELRWTNGTLQQATSLTGPWADVAGNPASPYQVTPAAAATFYRSRL